jgi:PIN domain nuclease of toxin-antitoxin system
VEVVADLGEQIGLRLCDLPFAEVVRSAAKETWTRDPFDRLIVGQAAARGALLITKDKTIQEHYGRSVWSEPPASRK